MEKTLIELEDKGQDFFQMVLNEYGIVVRTEPFQTDIWAGAYIPIEDLKVGDLCLIHHPPHIVFGALKYKIKNIKPL